MRRRASSSDKTDLTTDEIRKSILRGAKSGCTQLGFSGGEPTIREDFIELVEYGKSLGYELIAVTTNGFRMAYLSYAEALIDAGLTSVNISVHGACSQTHNAMMRTPDAFTLAIKAIQNVQKIKRKTKSRIEMMSMCLGSPSVLKEFPEHIRLMGQLGIRLHMIQPFIMNPGNTDFAMRMHSDYAQLAEAVRAGSEVARLHGGHIKLFNTPVCMFWDIEGALERQRAPLTATHVGRVRPRNTRKLKRNFGYYRIEQCRTCDEPCNGFRIESFPQASIVNDITKAIEDHCGASPHEDLWIGGLELLKPGSLERVLVKAREHAPGKVALVTKSRSRSYSEQYSQPILKLVDEIEYTEDNYVEWLQKVEDYGWEGLMLRDGNSYYENKRTS